MVQVTEQISNSVCRFIGEMLLEQNLISSEQLAAAISRQQSTQQKLGEILVEQKLISQTQLVELLEAQLLQRLSVHPTERRQLGEILLSLHAVSRWQLSTALARQGETRQKIGELLIALGYTSKGLVEEALSHQSSGQSRTHCCSRRRSLGELLLQSNRVTPEELERALLEQRQSHDYLGSILVRQGSLSEDELEDLLAAQLLLDWQHDHSSPEASYLQPVHKRLGEILVATHQLTPKQLSAAVAEQQTRQNQRLGDILLEKGLLPLKELLRALRLQKRLATLAMATLTGMTVLSACGTPQVPLQMPQNYYQVQQVQQFGRPANVRQGPFRTLQVESGANIQVYQNGSRVIDGVPFFRQGNDNTCGQAVITTLVNFWGIDMDYQAVVNEANPNNLPTTDAAMTNYLRSKGLQAQPFRRASLENLIHQVNQGRPTPVLLDFGGLSQEHYVIVVGYNPDKNTMIVHDSLEGPYIEMPSARFVQMWENQSLQSVHIFGGENYRRIMFDVFRE